MINADEKPRKSKWHFSRWASWTRKRFNVATCSKHCEGFLNNFEKEIIITKRTVISYLLI